MKRTHCECGTELNGKLCPSCDSAKFTAPHQKLISESVKARKNEASGQRLGIDLTALRKRAREVIPVSQKLLEACRRGGRAKKGKVMR